tara:strand:- start:167 stop:466 length:300 start_codon:yes stop_codon:yes gene_type:complete
MTTSIRIAQVEGGAGGNGVLVDVITSTTIADTRIRQYFYAVSAIASITLSDSKGIKIRHFAIAANDTDSVYMQDLGVRCEGTVSVAGLTDAGRFFIYYG